MDTQSGVSRSVTSANSTIWTMRCLMAVAFPGLFWITAMISGRSPCP